MTTIENPGLSCCSGYLTLVNFIFERFLTFQGGNAVGTLVIMSSQPPPSLLPRGAAISRFSKFDFTNLNSTDAIPTWKSKLSSDFGCCFRSESITQSSDVCNGKGERFVSLHAASGHPNLAVRPARRILHPNHGLPPAACRPQPLCIPARSGLEILAPGESKRRTAAAGPETLDEASAPHVASQARWDATVEARLASPGLFCCCVCLSISQALAAFRALCRRGLQRARAGPQAPARPCSISPRPRVRPPVSRLLLF